MDGIRVLDVSQGAAGPTAAAILGDHGADVVKVEPTTGEWGRGLGPPFWHGSAVASQGMNRNKRGLALDLKAPGGADVFRRLAGRSDVLLESFRPGVMDRLGLGPAALTEAVPQLVYCSITAFGSSGPLRDKPGVDGVLQAMSGFMSITGIEGAEPVKAGLPAADMTTGLQAAQGVLLALLARQRTGRGQHVSVSLLDSMLAFQQVPLTMYLDSRELPRKPGSGAAYSTPNEAYRTRDGAIMIAAYTPERWRTLCTTLGRPDLVDDPRFIDNAARMRHRAQLRVELEGRLSTRDTADWLPRLEAADLMCAPILDYEALVASEQVAVNGMIASLPHPLGAIETIGVPIRLSATPAPPLGSAPLVGEHTAEVLAELGYSAPEITRLQDDGVVLQRSTNDQAATAPQSAARLPGGAIRTTSWRSASHERPR
ncbi:CoA transferase [Geodermatophilus sabuli]|uniref:CoA transferase n=1 Tax=Geodermatophilus sabuli TaxID=1564158 RepID=A0A7K3W3Y2_9ACTN|nr:CoA transferase [Geodermatophilus sabuli]NEK59585.1 CoA transferase [Geodermatophilus sabuli]